MRLPLPGHDEMEDMLGEQLTAATPLSLAILEIQGLRALALLRDGNAVTRLVERIAVHLQDQPDLVPFQLLDGQFGLLFTDAYDEVEERCHQLRTLPTGTKVCIGIGRLREDDTEQGALHARAELALAQARRRGPGSIVTLTHGGNPDDHVGPDHAAAMLTLLRDGEVRIHYQPIVTLEERRVVAYEALARPQLSHDLPGPETASAVAERMGLSVDLDTLCRRSIFADSPGLMIPPAARLHINLAAEALGHSSLSARELHRQASDAGIEPERIVFEITQKPAYPLHERRSELAALRKLGFGLCLDNLGGGSSCMLSVEPSCFSMVKVSPRVTAGLGKDRYADAIFDGICAYASTAGIRVVVGGVEDSDQLALLRRYRIAGKRPIFGLQGYHLGEPSRYPGVAGDDEPTLVDDGRPSRASSASAGRVTNGRVATGRSAYAWRHTAPTRRVGIRQR